MLTKRSKRGQQTSMLRKVLLGLTQLVLLVKSDYSIGNDYYCSTTSPTAYEYIFKKYIYCACPPSVISNY